MLFWFLILDYSFLNTKKQITTRFQLCGSVFKKRKANRKSQHAFRSVILFSHREHQNEQAHVEHSFPHTCHSGSWPEDSIRTTNLRSVIINMISRNGCIKNIETPEKGKNKKITINHLYIVFFIIRKIIKNCQSPIYI